MLLKFIYLFNAACLRPIIFFYYLCTSEFHLVFQVLKTLDNKANKKSGKNIVPSKSDGKKQLSMDSFFKPKK